MELRGKQRGKYDTSARYEVVETAVKPDK